MMALDTAPSNGTPGGASNGSDRPLASAAAFTLQIGESEAEFFKVVSFRGREAMSELYDFRALIAVEGGDVDCEAQLGRACVLRIEGENHHGGHVRRHVHGIVRRFELRRIGQKLSHYAVQIVPVHWLLTRRKQSRIFQKHNCPDMSVPGIIRSVFADAGLTGAENYRFALKGRYEPRDYVVQYRESDMAFVSRLLEEEGIFYFFEHTHAISRMVMGDSDAAAIEDPEFDHALYREPTGFVSPDHVFEVRDGRAIRPGAVTLDDFDFKRPPQDLKTNAHADRFQSLELSDFPGDYTDMKDGERYAATRLEEQQCRRRLVRMRTHCRLMRPGYRFALREHPDKDLNIPYFITRVTHEGRQSQSGEAETVSAPSKLYRAECATIPFGTRWRPARRTRKPRIHGAQTAIVVGPQDEEIYTDEYGRVKVQFHWDRVGVHDERSSCWIRVSQGMAGGQYGTIFLPRVGQEVVVSFLEGDPDRPLITGRVYNQDHMPPYALPEHKTISAIRTCSSKRAGGGNEIRFEDAKNKEQLLLHAQNSLHVRTRGSRYESTGGQEHHTVGKNAYELYKESKHSIVKLDLIEEIEGSKNLKVKGDIKQYVAGEYFLFASKQYNLSNGDGIFVGSDKNIVLWCKGNFIKIDEEGVTIVGKTIKLNSGGSAGVAMPNTPTFAEEPIGAATTQFGHNVRYNAQPSELPPIEGMIKPLDDEEKTESEASWIEIEMVDDNGQPWPNEPFQIRTPEGKLINGVLDGKGQARVLLREPGACEICFPKLDADAWEKL